MEQFTEPTKKLQKFMDLLEWEVDFVVKKEIQSISVPL